MLNRYFGCKDENEVGNENENTNTFQAYNPNGTDNPTQQQQQLPAYGQQPPPPPPPAENMFGFNQPIQNDNQNASRIVEHNSKFINEKKLCN